MCHETVLEDDERFNVYCCSLIQNRHRNVKSIRKLKRSRSLRLKEGNSLRAKEFLYEKESPKKKGEKNALKKVKVNIRRSREKATENKL